MEELQLLVLAAIFGVLIARLGSGKMCLIIYKPKDKLISKERLKQAFQANSDGWGILGGKDIFGSLWHAKDCTDFDHFYKFYKSMKVNMLIHFRTASSGFISTENCHPIFINDNLAFMQNGNLYEYSNHFPGRQRDKQTDIQRFNKEVLQCLPNGFLGVPEIRDALELYCVANFTKIVFMDSCCNIEIINEQAGEWENGIWYSNGGIRDYIGYGYSGAYAYRLNDVRHKGGLISVQQFSSGLRTKWAKCPSCEGWFLKEKLNPVCNDCRIWRELLKYV